jgi:hypothetical protein
VLLENLTAFLVVLTERNGFHSRPFQTEREAADSAEQVEDSHALFGIPALLDVVGIGQGGQVSISPPFARNV